MNRIFPIRLAQEPRKEASYLACTNFVLKPSPHVDQTCICGERNRFAVPLRDPWLDETFLLVKVKKLSRRQQGVREDWLTLPFPRLTGKPIPDATPNVRYIANGRTFVPYSAEYLADRLIPTGTTQRQELYVKFYAREQCTPEDELNIATDQGEKCYRCSNDRRDAAHKDHPSTYCGSCDAFRQEPVCDTEMSLYSMRSSDGAHNRSCARPQTPAG
jgi:hypothetical protein